MDIKKGFKVELKKYPTNLFRDDKMKTQISHFINKHQRQMLEQTFSKAQNEKLVNDTLSALVVKDPSSLGEIIVLENIEAIVKGVSDDQLGDRKALTKLYPFADKPLTSVYTIRQIVEEEKGKRGLDDLLKKESQLT